MTSKTGERDSTKFKDKNNKYPDSLNQNPSKKIGDSKVINEINRSLQLNNRGISHDPKVDDRKPPSTETKISSSNIRDSTTDN